MPRSLPEPDILRSKAVPHRQGPHHAAWAWLTYRETAGSNLARWNHWDFLGSSRRQPRELPPQFLLRLEPVQLVRPSLDHVLPLRQELRAALGPVVGIPGPKGKLVLNEVRPEIWHLVWNCVCQGLAELHSRSPTAKAAASLDGTYIESHISKDSLVRRVPVPFSAVVLVDRSGVAGLYYPGAMGEADPAQRIEALL